MVAQSNDTAARRSRYVARHALRSLTSDLRVEGCGYRTLGGAVELRHDGTRAALAGLVTCGRIWLCPVCNSKVMARRALEVGAALAWVQSQGLSMLWGSFTVQHDSSTSLASMLGIQRTAWRRIMLSKTWTKKNATVTVEHSHTSACDWSCERRRDVVDAGGVGRVGYLRAAELTVGRNGWHPHFHPLMVHRADSADDLQEYADRLRSLWAYEVRAAGGRAADNDAQHLRVVTPAEVDRHLGAYLTKATYDGTVSALEVVWSQGKTRPGRDYKTRAHWALLADAVAGRDVSRQWHELESSIGQHRALVWSRGLRSMAGLGAEVEDETLAAETCGGPEDHVVFISLAGWRKLRSTPERVAQVLTVQETSGWEAVRLLLDSWGVQYFHDAADYLAA